MQKVQDSIEIVADKMQKNQWEQQHRFLWRNSFGDPLHYEDFYFENVYSKNRVYAMSDKGMVHLNYYRCNVMGKELELPYIVGVSTDEQYRRQGVMRSLLEKAMNDMYEQRVPFTYLMPASEAYYLPFGFRSVSKRLETEVKCNGAASSKGIQYLSYRGLQEMSSEFRLQLLENINSQLEEQHDVFAKHDEDYYDLLYAEKHCQNGDIVFCFNNELDVGNFCGMFAYAMDGDVPYVEQVIAKNQEQLIAGYFTDAPKIKIVISYPYMIRIVHREAFLDLFGEKLSRLCDLPPEELTDTQMIDILFEEKDSIFFAEIV